MIGLRVRYNETMFGTVIDENSDHVLIQFDSGSKYCVLKSGIESRNFFYCQRQIEGESMCKEQCEHCKEYYKPLTK
jgi:hypothetical protein